MRSIELSPNQTVETTDPHVMVSVRPIPTLGVAAYKVVLVVETNDGRTSVPANLPLVSNEPLP